MKIKLTVAFVSGSSSHYHEDRDIEETKQSLHIEISEGAIRKIRKNYKRLRGVLRRQSSQQNACYFERLVFVPIKRDEEKILTKPKRKNESTS